MPAQIEALLRQMLWNPGSTLELVLSAFLGVVAFVTTVRIAGSALGLHLAVSGRAMLTLIIGLAVELGMLSVLAAQPLPSPVLPVAAGAVLLLIVVPVACLLLKGGYLSTLFTLLIAMAATLVVTLFVSTTFSALDKSGSSVERGRDHRRTIEKAIDSP